MNASTPAAKPRFSLPRLPGYLHASDVQGLAQLATQAALGVTGLAENVQGNAYKAVAALLGPPGGQFIDGTPGRSGIRANGITGLVYGGVKGITRLAGGTVNAVLSSLVPLATEKPSSRRREAMLAALNGVLGDRLQDSANPLAIQMRLRCEGQALALDKSALAQRLPGATGKVLVLLHGLCMNDLQWRAPGAARALHPAHDHGLLLADQLGYTPVYLHYNSGLHVSANGAQLAGLLEQLLAAWPQPVEELALLGHSMGGLVAARFVALAIRPVQALVMSSPALDPGLNAVQKLLLAVLPKIAPNLRVGNGLDASLISHDPAVVAAYRADRLVHDRVSGRLARFIAEGGPATVALAPTWKLPTLLMYAGADKLVNPAGSRAFAAAAPKQVVSSLCFETLYHEIFNELNAEPVFATLKQWLDARF